MCKGNLSFPLPTCFRGSVTCFRGSVPCFRGSTTLPTQVPWTDTLPTRKPKPSADRTFLTYFIFIVPLLLFVIYHAISFFISYHTTLLFSGVKPPSIYMFPPARRFPYSVLFGFPVRWGFVLCNSSLHILTLDFLSAPDSLHVFRRFRRLPTIGSTR